MPCRLPVPVIETYSMRLRLMIEGLNGCAISDVVYWMILQFSTAIRTLGSDAILLKPSKSAALIYVECNLKVFRALQFQSVG